MSRRPPLWTPEEARAEAEREGESDEGAGSMLMGCLGALPWDAGGCAVDGCLTAASWLLLIAGGFLLLR